MDHYKDLLEGVVLTEEYFEKPPNHQVLGSALIKSQNPRTKNTLNLRVYGAYSLPQQWIDKVGDPSEDQYQYQVKMGGIEVKGAKLKPRQQTEEEKAEAEALKGKKKGKGDDEPLPEEIAHKEKIESEREMLEELPERERFFKIHEDPTKDVSLQFEEQKQSLQLNNEKLWEFEEVVNDDNGTFLEFNKVQAPEEEGDAKKKGGKGKAAEPVTPLYSKGWVDFTPFLVPGKKHTLQRIPLKVCSPPLPDVDEDENNEKADNNQEDEKEPENIFEEPQTYIYVHISTEFPINPSTRPGEEEEPEKLEAEGEEKAEVAQEEKEKEEQPQEEKQDEEEPADSYIEEDEFFDDAKPKIEVKPEVFKEVDSNLGYFASTADATANFRIIIQKYLKKISDHYSIVMAPDETEQKTNSKVTAIASHTSVAQRQRRIEKYILHSNKMYAQLKKELKMAIHRIIRDKYHKAVSQDGLDKSQRAEFVAELYTYLCQQIRTTLEATVNKYRGQIHEDLIEDLLTAMKNEHERKQQTFKEEYQVKLERLAWEYENIGNYEKAEQYYTKLLLKDPNNVDRMLNLARFSLKQGNVDKGYEYFRKAKETDPKSEKLTLAFAGILIERERYTEARRVLKEILDEDFKHCHANILYSLICEVNNRPGLVRKHIAIAKVQRMRELELLPRKIREIPNLNEINFKLERPNWNNITTKDQGMDSKENDKLFFEVIEFMLKYNLTKIAGNLLKYIQNNDSDKFRLEFARVKHQEQNYSDAVESLDKVLAKNENHPAALILRGNTYFDEGNIFDSEESYIKFIQNCSVKDAESKAHYYSILERLGMVYIERKAWKDAKSVFLKCTKENTTMNSWLNLGIACLRLQNYEEAEDALTQANYLDSHNPDVWGYVTLLCLKYPHNTRIDQAEFCILRALKLGIKNNQLLEEIGDMYSERNVTFALAWYDRAIQVNDTHGELFEKYGNLIITHRKHEKPKAIELLRQALDKVKGKHKILHIALILQKALKEEGRDNEAEELDQYTQGAVSTN